MENKEYDGTVNMLREVSLYKGTHVHHTHTFTLKETILFIMQIPRFYLHLWQLGIV